ncbi:cation:proton antiporter domain-containing protein [Enhygromyxa salina]|uniref:Inner membrane protein YbaL n=1 Tax=Enhygromyxa salina TaxID=215803 RepID=A0A2S9YXY6_9BACT|nr:cation:proton antiporter [Enhygromyxa salina]PRQ09951.1 Inner membrane protein YbaL [Enhygromyxa salina]
MSHLVVDLAVVLGVAALISVVFQKLGQSTVLGYLFAGLVVGPYIPVPVFADAGRIAALSEFGVVLVMFAVGLEFSIRRLLRVLPVAGFTGLVQVCAMMGLGFGLARALGFTTIEGVFLGACVAISSTMVVAKVFDEHPPEARVRELVFGVLVVQDMAAIVLVAGLTAVAAGSGLSSDMLASTLANLLGLLVALTVTGLLVVPRAIRFIADLGKPETLLVAVVALCFGLAALAESFGYSVALGAFLAGTLVAEAGRTHQIEHVVHPVRDLFAAVFFVSIGMSVDPMLAIEHAGVALIVAVLVVAGQFLTVSAAGILSGNGVRRSITAGLSLGQIGEFAFIIAAIGASAEIVGPFLQPVVVTVAVLTAFTTPLMARVAERVAGTVDRALPKPLQTFASLCESWFEAARRAPAGAKNRSHLRNAGIVITVDAAVIAVIWVVIARWGRQLADMLGTSLGLQGALPMLLITGVGVLLTLPLVVAALRSARRAGQLLAERVFPARSPGALDPGAAPRRAFVVALQSMVMIAVAAPIVLALAPFTGVPGALAGLAMVTVVLGVLFWRSATNLQGHVRAGATAIVDLLGRQMADDPASASLPSVDQLLPGFGATTMVVVPAGAAAAGQTLAGLNVRAATGATIIAISRDGQTISVPSGHEPLVVGDVIALAGAEHAVEAATALLTRATHPVADAATLEQPEPDDPEA